MENTPLNSPSVLVDKQTKDKAKTTKAGKLNPVFQTLQPEDFTGHLRDLVKREGATSHKEILTELLKRFEPLDFDAMAFPQRAKMLERAADLRAQTEERDPDTGALKPKEGISSPDRDKLRYEANELEKKANRMVVKQKEILILSIENLRKVAEANLWGLCKNLDFTYIYNGQYWNLLERDTFKKFLGEAAEQMGAGKFTARHYKFRDELLNQFNSTEYLPTPETRPEAVHINLLNGTFEIIKGESSLRAFDPKDFITYQLGFCYDPNAKAPIWQSYLDRVLPDRSKQQVLAEYMGYVFIKNGGHHLKLEKALVLYGTGANGKSVFYEVVNAMLGTENVSSYSLESLTDRNGYYRAAIANKLVNYASEISGHLESAMFKQLASGEPVEARHPYGKAMVLNQYAKLIFNCNELPREVEHTTAFFRRFLIVPFDETIPENEQDKELHCKIIASELPAVFNWVLDGLNRLLQQKKFTDCTAAKEAVDRYRREADSVQMFIDDRGYVKSVDSCMDLKTLYTAYKVFCQEDLFRALGKPNFKKRLEATGVQVDRRNHGYVVFLNHSIGVDL